MNIEHIKLFVRIAVLHNISLAGKEFGLSAAVSSVHMNKLEESLGVRLLHRTTRQVSLTEEGVAFLPHAVDILDSVEAARGAVGAGNVSPQGKLRVAVSASFGRLHIVPALCEFLQLYPQLSIDIHLSDSVIDMVEGGFDLAIRDTALQDSTLVARKLAPVRRILCASPDYISRYGEPLNPEALADHQCISLIGLDVWKFDHKSGVQGVRINSRLRTDNGESARDAAVAGMGITLSSTWCCYQQILSGELVQVLSDFPLVAYTNIWAVYPSSRLLAPKVRVFIDFFAERFAGTPYWECAGSSYRDVFEPQ